MAPDRTHQDGVKVDVLTDLVQIVGDLYTVAKRSATHSGEYPVASVIAVGVFMMMQKYIDARDPKLSKAPLWRDEHIYFTDDESPVGKP
jgi:hypothetical protein